MLGPEEHRVGGSRVLAALRPAWRMRLKSNRAAVVINEN
jgi:hypothetical protein